MGSLWQDSATIDHARDAWASADVIAGIALNPFHDLHPLDTLAKDDVTPIAPSAGIGSDEKLGRVGVRAPVGHREKTTTIVRVAERFVWETWSVN